MLNGLKTLVGDARIKSKAYKWIKPPKELPNGFYGRKLGVYGRKILYAFSFHVLVVLDQSHVILSHYTSLGMNLAHYLTKI